MPNLALLDLVLPYLLRGENLGAQHAALSVLRVVSYETSSDDTGVTFRGRCEFNGYASIDPSGSGLRIDAGVDEGARAFDPNRRSPVFDIRETAVDFELFVPRSPSAIIATGEAGIAAAGFTNARTVLTALQSAPVNDYPSSGFVLDLVLQAPTVRPPFMHPAKLTDQGVLTPDPSVREVAITLPRLRFRLSHGNPNPSQLRFELTSLGVSSLDDPGDFGVAELITMTPNYAYFGGQNDKFFGIGFRSATLDLSADWTPPGLKDKAQVGDDWTGLYLPEARIFVAPDGLRNFAFECGAQELLIGLGATGGVWGDFEAGLVNQGSGTIAIDARFTTPNGRAFGTTPDGANRRKVRVPDDTRMIVDIRGGRAPYTCAVRVGAGAEQSGRNIDINLSAATPSVDIVIRVTDSSATPVDRTLTVRAERILSTPALATPGPVTPQQGDATLGATTGDFVFELTNGSGEQVTVRVVPSDDQVRWTVDAGAESAAATSVDTTVAAAASRTVRARKPAAVVPSTLDYYFFFDDPPPTDISTVRAVDKHSNNRMPGAQSVTTAYAAYLDALPSGATITIRGHASFEGTDNATTRQYNYLLAGRRATATRDAIAAQFSAKNFHLVIDPTPAIANAPTTTEINAWVSASSWLTHTAPNDRDWWRAIASLPADNAPERTGQVTVTRPAVTTPPPPVHVDPPPPAEAPPPDWFRSAKVKVRIVDSVLIALQMDCEVDFQTFAEQRLTATGQAGGAIAPRGRTLQNGTPLGPDNPADGITKFRVLVQTDPATQRWLTLLSVGADPNDTDGLFHFGWIPGETVPAAKDFWLTLLGSYLSFWPLLAAAPPVDAVQNAVEGRPGAWVDCTLAGVALVTPAVVAAIPWFRVERVKLYGAEFLTDYRSPDFESSLLFDVGVDWSANILDLVIIPQDHPLAIRYKAIGLRFNAHDDTTDRWALRPVFDSSRGYTIDLASGGGLQMRDPLGKILRILGARLSRSNPLTFEIDIGLGVDLGVVSVDRASIRAYLDEPRPPELTALAARVDIPGALVGSGYMKIGSHIDPNGVSISTIGGQIDITLRPINLRIAAALEIATIPPEAGGPATGVYVGLNVVLPAGIPLGPSGIGIFGFRGIFGMHYQRNPGIGIGSNVPALRWLEAADGQPHLLVNPEHPETPLWVPHIDHWAFGLGMLIGTMEGGYIINLDGTLLLELPGPRLLIMLNARIVSLPPSMDGLGQSGGILAVIEITPEHFLIGILVQWEIEDLVKIVIPIEAVFPFGSDRQKWHIYLGARPDYGPSVEIDVLGIVRGTGYLMFKGDGLRAYTVQRAQLPEIRGFGIGLGVGASFTWGSVSSGLYLRIGGGMDAVIGFDPFTIAGTIWVAGELRLWIVSIGADAQLTVIVAETSPGNLGLYIHGIACGHVDFFFFSVRGCVEITISSPEPVAPMPGLVDKVSLQSRSPALAQGTGVDRGLDTSLGTCIAQTSRPSMSDPNLPVVPIDAIPIISMAIPPVAAAGLTVTGLGTAVTSSPGAPADGFSERSGEKYRFEITSIALERVASNGSLLTPVVTGTSAPVVWWTTAPATDPSPVAQLALLTWFPTPATKAIEKTDHMVEDVLSRWGTICEPGAAAAEVLWTFKLEALGPSATGWSLDGIAWPDAPGTVRSQAPDTTVDVYESWRTGDPVLDGYRGILAALVIGGSVPCHKKPNDGGIVVGGRGGLGALGGLTTAPVRFDTISLRRERIVEPDTTRIVIGQAVLGEDDPVRRLLASGPRRADSLDFSISARLHAKATNAIPELTALASGEVLPSAAATLAMVASRQVVTARQLSALQPLAPVLDPPKLAAAAAAQCAVKVLQAPMFDDGRPTIFEDPATNDWVSDELAKLKKKHGPLDDVVVVATGPFVTFGVLLLVPRGLVDKNVLIVRSLAADGSELERVDVRSTHLVSSTPLPGRWTDLGGPWGSDIHDLLAYAASTPNVPCFVPLATAEKADRVEIGTQELPPQGVGDAAQTVPSTPRYWVAAIGMTSLAEVARQDWDDYQQSNSRTTLTNVLGAASSDNSLLVADSLYRVSVQWFAKRKGDNATRGSSGSPERQTFWFKTETITTDTSDPAQNPKLLFTGRAPVPPAPQEPEPLVPVRLDPWMLVTLPQDGEKCYFGLEHPRLVFNTHDVDRVFTAYGKELRIRFEAASGAHPDPADPNVPLTIGPATLEPTKATVLAPWEQAAVEAVGILDQQAHDAGLGGFCVPVDEERPRHSVVDIPIPLHAYMDYLLDVECVPAGSPEDTRGPSIYRRHFCTGGFATFEAFAASIVASRPMSRAAAPGGFEAVRAHFAGRQPQGSELDDQLRAQGLEPLPVPDRAAVTVFWQQVGANPPQPAAVLIDATEPLRRSRQTPRLLTDTTGPENAQRWILEDREWLSLRNLSNAGVVATNGVIFAPGDQRALVVLAAGARGSTVRLALGKNAFADLSFLPQDAPSVTVVDIALTRAPWEEE